MLRERVAHLLMFYIEVNLQRASPIHELKGVIIVQSQSKVQRVETRAPCGKQSLESPHSRNVTRDCTRTHSAASSVCTYLHIEALRLCIHTRSARARHWFVYTQQRHALRRPNRGYVLQTTISRKRCR